MAVSADASTVTFQEEEIGASSDQELIMSCWADISLLLQDYSPEQVDSIADS